MAFVKTKSKMTAIRAFINDWLKDQTFYCGNCLETWNPNFHVIESCCENPAFGRNIDHTRAVVKENARIRSNLKKVTAATDNNVMRYGVNLPPKLFHDLTMYFRNHGEKLFNTPREMRDFMRSFPQFCIPEKV